MIAARNAGVTTTGQAIVLAALASPNGATAESGRPNPLTVLTRKACVTLEAGEVPGPLESAGLGARDVVPVPLPTGLATGAASGETPALTARNGNDEAVKAKPELPAAMFVLGPTTTSLPTAVA